MNYEKLSIFSKNRAEFFFLICLTVAGLFLAISFYDRTYDDVYIAFRYAKNILSGNGFVFNPGENFLGTPAPFFVILLVIGKLLFPFLTIPQVGGLISSISLLLLSLLIYIISRSFGQRTLGALAAIFILINPFIIMTLGGETPLFLLLVTASFYFYYCRGQIYLPAILLTFSILNRIEGIVPTAIILGHFILTRRKFPSGASVLGLLIMSPWLIFAYLNFGSPLTNSMAAKIAQRYAGSAHFIYGGVVWTYHIIINNILLYSTLIPLLIFGLYYLVKRGRSWSILFIWIAGQTLGYLILDVPFYHWYIAQIGLGISILFAMGAIYLLEFFQSRSHLIYRIGLILVIFSIFFGILAQIQTAVNYHNPNPSNILYRETGNWFNANTEPGASIAYLEIGQIGYYSDRRIIDILGLVTPGASDRVKKGNFVWAYLNYQPDYIIYNPIFAGWIGVILQEPWFKESYTEVTRLTSPGYFAPISIYKKIPEAHLPTPLEVDIAQLKHDRPTGEIYGTKTSGQTFTAMQNNLSGIEVALTNYNRKNNKTVIFHLKNDPQSSSDIFRQEFPASEVLDKAGYLFHFPAIEDSKEKSFFYYLESPDSYEGNTISELEASNNHYKDGDLWTSNKSVDGKDLTFKTFYKK